MTQTEIAVLAALVKAIDFRRTHSCAWMGEQDALARGRELLTQPHQTSANEPGQVDHA